MKSFRHGLRMKVKLRDKVINGYSYICYKSKNNSIYIKCREHRDKHCPVVGQLINGEVIGNLNHVNHGPNPNLLLQMHFEKALYKAVSENPFESLRSIYDRVSIRHSVAAVSKSWISVQRSMRRWRSQQLPPIPRTLLNYAVLVARPEWAKFRRCHEGFLTMKGFVAVDGSLIVLIGDINFISSLRNIENFFIDSTFDVTPRKPKISQLTTILGLLENTAIPICWILMQRKTEAAYTAALHQFSTVFAPNLRPVMIMTDFEKAIINAIKNVYPDAVHRGCFFHFVQALLKKTRTTRLERAISNSEELKIFFRKLISLALLPANDIPRAFFWLVNIISPECRSTLGSYLQYFYRQWLRSVGSEGFTVFQLINRTNNFSEAYNKVLQEKIGHHQNIWKFTHNLQNVQNTIYIEYQSILQGINVRRQANLQSLARDELLWHAWELYSAQQLNYQQFLAFGNIFLPYKNDNVINSNDEIDVLIDNYEREIDDVFIPGGFILECQMCFRNITDNISENCMHWIGCTMCVSKLLRVATRNNANIQCHICNNIINRIIKAF